MTASHVSATATYAGSIDRFAAHFACQITGLPEDVMLLGWSAEDQAWFCAPEAITRTPVFQHRIPPTLHFLTSHVVPALPMRTFWTLLCLSDGWRERNLYSDNYCWVDSSGLERMAKWQGEPGEMPILSPQRRWLACYGAHRGDPSAFLLPEAHYLINGFYEDMFLSIRGHRVPWRQRQSRAIYCAGNHGEVTNFLPPLDPTRPHPRLYLQQVVATSGLNADIHLGQHIPHRQQLGYKYILDVDGFARTWDAWAWKMQSGSTVLSATSPWESFFTRLFQPWQHYVPVANDFSDLGEKLAWCIEHDTQCEDIARGAHARAKEVYRPDYAACILAADWANRMSQDR